MNECGFAQDSAIYCLDMAVACVQLTGIYSSQPRMLFLVFGGFMSFLLLYELVVDLFIFILHNIVALSNIALSLDLEDNPHHYF